MNEMQMEHDEKVRLLEARIQTLTEDKDILSRELSVNNHWIDNQQALADALERNEGEKVALQNRVSGLERRIRRMLQVRRRARAQPDSEADTDDQERMSFTQTNVNALFNIHEAPQPQDQPRAGNQ